MVRVPSSHGGSHRFESRIAHQKKRVTEDTVTLFHEADAIWQPAVSKKLYLNKKKILPRRLLIELVLNSIVHIKLHF